VPFDLENRLVVGVASSALFDLDECDSVFRQGGEEAYRKYQEENLSVPLKPGVAFPFLKRLLSLNNIAEIDDPLVEVIVLSQNDPDTGLRVMRSIDHHHLLITRAIFMQGQSPYRFMSVLNMSLFLSANATDVRQAVSMGLPAGQVLESTFVDDNDEDLRIAFDFDGVLANDESERVMQAGGLKNFHEHEVTNVITPHAPGPLRDFLANINKIQKCEEGRRSVEPNYKIRLRVSVVTARNAPSHERAVMSLKAWGVTVNDAFFLGGVEKGLILGVLRPHIFFDDQESHLKSTSQAVPSVHVPFGAINGN
jgi:5'-nucleotidase